MSNAHYCSYVIPDCHDMYESTLSLDTNEWLRYLLCHSLDIMSIYLYVVICVCGFCSFEQSGSTQRQQRQAVSCGTSLCETIKSINVTLRLYVNMTLIQFRFVKQVI